MYYIYTMKILYLHSVCKINVCKFYVIDLTCVLQDAVSSICSLHISLRCDSTVTKALGLICIKPTSQGHKIVAMHSVRFTSNTTHSARLRAGQAMERAALRSARSCGNGSPSLCWRAQTSRCFSSRTRVTQGGSPLLGLVYTFLTPTEIKMRQ